MLDSSRTLPGHETRSSRADRLGGQARIFHPGFGRVAGQEKFGQQADIAPALGPAAAARMVTTLRR